MKMKHYETIRVIPLDVLLEANFVVSMPLDESSVTVQEFETVQSTDGDDYFDPGFEMY